MKIESRKTESMKIEIVESKSRAKGKMKRSGTILSMVKMSIRMVKIAIKRVKKTLKINYKIKFIKKFRRMIKKHQIT